MEYILNPEIIILQKDGQFITDSLSSIDKKYRMESVDLIILNNFITPCTIKKSVDSFVSGLQFIDVYTQQEDIRFAENKIRGYIEHSILVNANTTGDYLTNCKDIKKINSLPVTDSKCSVEKKYKLSNNFALLVSEQGFLISLSHQEEYYQLPLEYLLVLSSVVGRKTMNEVISELGIIKKEDVEKIFYQLAEKKLIIEEVKHPFLSLQTTSQIKQENQVSQKQNWMNLESDNRIPVYFVPHMENHYPLALGLLHSSLSHYDGGRLQKIFNFIPISYFTPEVLLNQVYRKFGKGIWLFSNYMWSIDLNLKISKLVKNHNPENITIHGGPSTPNYLQASRDFMNKNNSVDISVHNEGEVTICEVLDSILINHNRLEFDNEKLSGVQGITYRHPNQDGEYIKTANRERMAEPDQIPSPYIEGTFDGYDGRVDAAIVESNRGCPFGCTFCDWGSAISQKVRKYDLERVKNEIRWIAEKSTKILWIADANFGMYDRDIELASFIVEMKKKHGFPQEVVVNYTKNSTWRLAEIIKIFTEGQIVSQGIISIQTTDEKTLEVINRKNIKTEKYDELAQVFSDLNLPLSTDLMIGLPGITVQAFKNDLQRYMDLDVSVKAYPTQLLPNSPMANPEYLEKYQIKTDENDFIISSFSFSEDELKLMKQLNRYYMIADGYSVLRYVMRYLQWEYQVKAIDFLHDLLMEINSNTEELPFTSWVFRYFDTAKFIPVGWYRFYAEISEYIVKTYPQVNTQELSEIIKLNQSCMPVDSCDYPLSIELKYDCENYFKHNLSVTDDERKKLYEFGNATFSIDDPGLMAHINYESLQYDSHQYFWELDSSISRAKSKV